MDKPSRLCVDLSAAHVADPAAWRRTLVAGLDGALADAGYAWSRRESEKEDGWIRRWHLSEPRRGEPYNHVTVRYSRRGGRRCDLRVDVYADMLQPHGQLEWEAFFLLRDRVLPSLLPRAAVRVLEHPGLWTPAWEVPGLAARFSPGEELPEEVQERVDDYQERSAAGRWWERASAAARAGWDRTGGAHAYGAVLYFLFPPNWAAFAAFALAAVLGRRVVRTHAWRTAGFVALAVVLLTPVKVPTFVGLVYMPHGFVQMYDFDPHYYFREPAFALAAGLCTAALAWLVLRMVRRRSPGGLSD